ncbi:ABC-ATPase domain-containing protein [Bacillaceae bacterium SIJ1]|uniref:ABC-ATPase domain-containing protein n=1 Tax=Litoribacterium kuwaitense TaxID=1398745 RepID=UPI0013EBDA6A|nr:ABC-ATPase domain-containing protein [Litoribacterium kuwaitense]NGP43851.1 ABC-ATPase domain-containing protein [Litoribacterium kuwaitense]
MEHLREHFKRIDRKGYKAYKDVRGRYQAKDYELMIDFVQGDPFASPSRVRLHVPLQRTVISSEDLTSSDRKRHLADGLVRRLMVAIKKYSRQSWIIDVPGQEVLERTAASFRDEDIEICLSVVLPARGRTILGKQATVYFFEQLPKIIDEALFQLDRREVERVLTLCDKQQALRQWLKREDLLAFIANDAILPRKSGVSQKPLSLSEAVLFQSPQSFSRTFELPDGEQITGMAIPNGITLFVGGGYHGKSTVLEAIERGVYDHIEGDGREFVLTDCDAVKVRAADGRAVTSVDISPFITALPFQKDTRQFSTANASGSTSQAASIIEALESGASALLIDEDTSATNFMIRDERMQTLVAKEKEPITPFVDKVTQLYEEKGISSLIVMGGSGDYFDCAHHVILLDHYQPYDVTAEAKKVSATMPSRRRNEGGSSFGTMTQRTPTPPSIQTAKGKKQVAKARSKTHIQLGVHDVDLSDVEQLVDTSQTRAIASIFQHLENERHLGHISMAALAQWIESCLDQEGLRAFTPFSSAHPGDLARPRRLEICAAFNRLRTLHIESKSV